MTTFARIDLIEHAAALIDAEAVLVRDSHTAHPGDEIPADEPEARLAYDELKLTAHQLYKLADVLRAEAGITTTVPDWAKRLCT